MSCRSVQTDPRVGLRFLTSFLALAVRVHLRPCDGKGGWEPCWVTPWIPGSWQDEPLYRVSTKKYMSLLINMGADTQRNAFPGSVTNQSLCHCEVTPSLCPGSTPFSVPPARLLDWYLGPLKVNHASILSSTVQIFFIFVCDVYDVCVCVCAHVCYGACQRTAKVLSFHLTRVRVSCLPTINTRLTGLNCYAPCLCLPSLCGRIRCVLRIQTQPLTLLRQALCPLNHLPSPV